MLGAQWLAIGVVGAVSFLLNVFIARSFGPEAFGVYVQAITLGMFLLVLVDGGFSKLLLRETARSTPALAGDAKNLHSFAYGHGLTVTALLLAVVLVVPLPAHPPTLVATVLAFAITAFIYLSLAILRGEGRLVRDALWQISSRIVTATLMIAVISLGADAPWQVLAAQFVGGLFFLAYLMRAGWVLPKFYASWRIYRVLLPLVWLDLATTIYFRSDMVLFKFADVPKADIGAYGVAFRVIDAVLLLASPVSLILFRHFRLSGEDLRKLPLRRIARLAGLGSGIGLMIFLLALPTADWFFAAIFGAGFELAGDLFKVLCLMLVFALGNGILGQGIFALGLDRQYVWTATTAAVINVSGNYLLLPAYGVWAAAWMTVATEMVLACGLAGALWRYRLSRH